MLSNLDPKWVIIIVTAIICAVLIVLALDLPAILIHEDQ